MKKVLITGARGFIGRQCLPLLVADNYEVHAVSRSIAPQGPNTERVIWHHADLLDQVQLENLVAHVQPTHLLHFAWYSIPGKYWTSLDNVRWAQASLALLQAFTRHGGQRVVMAGTCAEYNWDYGYCSEYITPLAPKTLYGTCKHSVQMILRSFAEQQNLSAAWGRMFFLFGPYEHPDRLVSSVIRSLLNRENARCSHGNQLRDFLYVHDVASAFVALMDSQVTGAVNIASGQPVRLKDMIYAIADHLNGRELVQLNAITSPPDEPSLILADTRRLYNEVGWLPKYDMEKGLVQTIEWWRQQLAVNEL